MLKHALKKKNILIVIPARGGSKRLPGKNIMSFNGRPLISYAIKAAMGSRYANKVIVSTDDSKIAFVAKKYGAEVPFVRPKKLSGDTAKSWPVLKHAVDELEKSQKYSADIVVLVQPTNPFSLSKDIDSAVETMVNAKTNSCFSVREIKERPDWMFVVKNGRARPFVKSAVPRLFIVNGSVYAVRRQALDKGKIIDNSTSVIIGSKERSADIDNLFEFKIAEFIMRNKKLGR